MDTKTAYDIIFLIDDCIDASVKYGKYSPQARALFNNIREHLQSNIDEAAKTVEPTQQEVNYERKSGSIRHNQ